MQVHNHYAHTADHTPPVMAVLVSNLTIRNLRRQIVNPRIKLLVEANKEVNIVLYYFSLKHVDLQERNITGCYWNSRYNKWMHEEFPFPDVLYIRGAIRKKYTHVFEELYNRVNSSGSIINHPRFNKWQLNQIMSQDPCMKTYLPATREVNQSKDIAEMLKEYQSVYLKSHLGRKGKNVLRVEVLPDGRYQYSYLKRGQVTTQTTFNFQPLLDFINEFFQGKSLLIQQSINLMKYKNRLIDLRAELQRNRNGEVEIVGISVRLGQLGSPITTHADAFKFDDFFRNQLHYSKEKLNELQSNVNVFLLRVYEFIERNYGNYVEIGIDFAIDKEEKIWLIEANSQSTKVSLEKSHDSAVLSRAYKNILEYARHVFEQTREESAQNQPVSAKPLPVAESAHPEPCSRPQLVYSSAAEAEKKDPIKKPDNILSQLLGWLRKE